MTGTEECGVELDALPGIGSSEYLLLPITNRSTAAGLGGLSPSGLESIETESVDSALTS